jgi:hypothetical protein
MKNYEEDKCVNFSVVITITKFGRPCNSQFKLYFESLQPLFDSKKNLKQTRLYLLVFPEY